MSREQLSSHERARHPGLSEAVVRAYIGGHVTQKEYGIILRAEVQRNQDLALNKTPIYPRDSGSAEAVIIMDIIRRLEQQNGVPEGIWDEYVALESNQ